MKENNNYPKEMVAAGQKYTVNNPQDEIAVIKIIKQKNGEYSMPI